jgi:maltose alpha-D-glucosyltransferase/alpha-amylase
MANPARQRAGRDPLWFKDAVIYEAHVRSFYDRDDDGIGDLRGLVDKLDYLQDLGVNCLWLLPFFPSPLKDDGYDIADYRGVHPSYGTVEDFRALVEAAHGRGIRVVIELVVNHTSDQHPWFQRARRAPRGSPERDYYVWSDTDARYREARIIFTDTERSNWTWDPEAKQYYWHRFFSHQPDLNFENPRVLEEVLDVLGYWAEMGVDGFRLDAVPYLVEEEGTSCENRPGTHQVIRKIRAYVDRHFPGRMLLAEANQWPTDVRPYFGEGDECHMAFHFPLMPRIFMALRLEDAEPIVDIMQKTPAIPDGCQWALFLRNHDELTLEMVSADERDYMYLAYGQDPRAKLNVGIRRRLAPLVDNSVRRIELLHSILFSFPGTPVVYYGDEIGMGDDVSRHDRNGVRTPMQWSADRNAGFSRADPQRLYGLPVSDPVYGYPAVNVEAQLKDPSSLLHWMRNTISLRKLFKAFGRGTIEFLPAPNKKVLAYVRRYEEDVLLCVANVSRFAQPVELDLSAFEGWVPVEMLGYTDFPAIGKLPYFLTLGPYGYYWFELRKTG